MFFGVWLPLTVVCCVLCVECCSVSDGCCVFVAGRQLLNVVCCGMLCIV